MNEVNEMKVNTKKKRFLLIGALAGTMAVPATVIADEFEADTWMYEDDAWYDVSEWFDGNDYNPTDEAIGRWDDEIFHFGENATSSDNDNFLNYGDYGYTDNDPTGENDWFYDYYDDGYLSWNDRYYTAYYDIDDDGLYDAMASYADTDGDGLYEDFDYVAFNQAGQDEQTRGAAQSEQKRLRSNKIELSGKMLRTKQVNVRDRRHVVAMLQRNGGKAVAVDMGRADALPEIAAETDVTATGHASRVGDKIILMATAVKLPDQEIQIDRSSSKFSGEIEKTRKVTIRGDEHNFVKLSTAEGKSALVDLGPATKELSPEVGQSITVQGVPTKVNDRIVLMARQVTMDGKRMKINRRMAMTD